MKKKCEDGVLHRGNFSHLIRGRYFAKLRLKLPLIGSSVMSFNLTLVLSKQA